MSKVRRGWGGSYLIDRAVSNGRPFLFTPLILLDRGDTLETILRVHAIRICELHPNATNSEHSDIIRKLGL